MIDGESEGGDCDEVNQEDSEQDEERISKQMSDITEIRFIDVELLEVREDFLQVEVLELVKQEIEAVLAQLWV